MKHSARAEENW